MVKLFPIEAIRAQFPSLAARDGPAARVYLDNPAGTQVPARVWEAIENFYRTTNANLGGYFNTSLAADRLFYGAYRALADFVGAKSEREIVIGPSMTALTFAFSRSLGRRFSPGDEIILTRMDHEGNVAPWLALAQERDLRVRWLPFDEQTWRIEPRALDGALSERTKLLALNYASNLTGSINDVRALATKAKQAGALVYVDAVQYSPHRLTDAASLGCDFLVCSAYKFYGPHIGVLWGREDVLNEMYSYKVRPVPDTLPEKFEVGTPQLELLAAALATVDYFEWLGRLFGASGGRRALIAAAFEHISAWERDLTAKLLDGLTSMPGIAIRGIAERNLMEFRVPTVSFTHEVRRSSEIAQALARRGIFVWSGHNFALETARSLGLDEAEGVVRIGLAHYNTPAEVETTLAAVQEAVTS
jgi:cysteine desulfurase family protein (TIGR01976 family)